MSYEILETAQVPSLSPRGEMRQMYRVYIVTGHGSTGFVDVAPADWETEKLKPILDKLAETLDLPYTLTG